MDEKWLVQFFLDFSTGSKRRLWRQKKRELGEKIIHRVERALDSLPKKFQYFDIPVVFSMLVGPHGGEARVNEVMQGRLILPENETESQKHYFLGAPREHIEWLVLEFDRSVLLTYKENPSLLCTSLVSAVQSHIEEENDN